MVKKNGVEFRQVMLSSSKYSKKAPYAMVAKKITYHNTDNMMPAINEIKYMIGNNLQVSYHIAVDEKEAIQAIPYNRNAWASGDGGNGYGNRNTVQLEICRNYDRSRGTTNLISPLKEQYAQAEINAVMYGAVVMYEQGIAPVLGNVKFHNDWNGKNCPSKILNERRGSAFKAFAVAEAIKYKAKMEGKPVPATPTTPQPAPKPTAPSAVPASAQTTTSVVDYLKLTGQNTSFENRAKLASQYGIGGYRGTASQNTELLNKLRAGLPSKPAPSPVPKPTGKGDMKTTSVVDYLVSIGEKGDFPRRKQLAEANGIRNYTGTAGQNADLLAKLRGGDIKPAQTAPAKPQTKNNTSYKGESIDEYLRLSDNKHLGGPSFDNRKKLANANGISGYRGTASQNLQLLNKLRGGGSAPKAQAKPKTYKVNQKVKIKGSATKYVTGQSIPNSVKGKIYTIMQMKGSDQALLKEIMSWVYTRDLD